MVVALLLFLLLVIIILLLLLLFPMHNGQITMKSYLAQARQKQISE